MEHRVVSAGEAAGLADVTEQAAVPTFGLNNLPHANQAALARAFARAEMSKADILRRPEMLSGEALAEQLGVSRATVDNRRVAGKLLALEFGSKRGVRYPQWQCEFVSETADRVVFESILTSLAPVGTWGQYRFFKQSSPALGGHTPIEALLEGRATEVARVAQSWANGDQGGG